MDPSFTIRPAAPFLLTRPRTPDGAFIASGSYDSTIKIWDATIGGPALHNLSGHTDGVHSVAYSPDGAYIAPGSFDNTVKIWDATIGAPALQNLTGHTSYVESVAYSPDGAYVVPGSYDNTIKMWDATNGDYLRI